MPRAEAERPYDVTGWTLPMQMGLEAPAITSIQEAQSEWRSTLIKDENDVRKDLALRTARADGSPIPNPIKRPRRIGIYKSWNGNMDEGWTRYVFDTFNVPYKSLLDAEVRSGSLSSRFDVIRSAFIARKRSSRAMRPETETGRSYWRIDCYGLENP